MRQADRDAIDFTIDKHGSPWWKRHPNISHSTSLTNRDCLDATIKALDRLLAKEGVTLQVVKITEEDVHST